jgi:hypothetical protein
LVTVSARAGINHLLHPLIDADFVAGLQAGSRPWSRSEMNEQMRMRLVVPGRLSAELTEWLEPLVAVERADGHTELAGVLPDQSAVHSICNRLRDLGISLDSMSVEKEIV